MNIVKVKGDSKPNRIAGALCQLEGPISIKATGPEAVNQATKAIAITTRFFAENESNTQFLCTVSTGEQRTSSKLSLSLRQIPAQNYSPLDTDLGVSATTDVFKLAGAIAQRLRDGDDVRITTKGAIPVLIALKSIAVAEKYTLSSLGFTVSLYDMTERGMLSTFVLCKIP